MYSEDPRNRKAPSILLGFIAITGALILALFLTGILKVHAETDLPYNYIAFVEITNSNVTFNDMSGEVLYSLPTFSGAPIPNQNYEAALNNLLSFIPASQCLVFIVDNLATKAVYEYVLDSFTSRYVTVLEVNTTIFPFDLTGYEIGYYPAGMWNVPIYTKTVPLSPTPSPSPTPTPDPSVTSSFGFLGYFTYSSMYYYVEVSGSNIFKSVELDIYNTDVSAAMSEVGTTDPNTIAGKSVYMNNTFNSGSSINWTGPYAYLYFTGDNITVKVYRMSSSLISDDVDYIKANYNYVTLNGSDTENSSYPWFTLYSVNELNCLVINYNYYRNTGSYNMVNKYGNNIDILESYSSSSLSYSNSVQLRKAYGALLTKSEEPVPTQDPDVSPSPTPTEAPHVIINWPSGTPTPTPPFSVPGNSGTGSGSSGSGSLSPGQIDSTLDTFKTYTENNNAFAFLYACTSVIPDEALYFLFILLFILILLACIRLFVHFTG